MKVVDCQQNTPEWHAARASIPTASEFSRIITATGNPSTQADQYATELAVEAVTGLVKPNFQSKDMENGHLFEPRARKLYSFVSGAIVDQPGFVYRDDDRSVGCSPDGLMTYLKKGLEIKCPIEPTHLGYLLNGILPKQYIPQVQGSMFVTGFEQWDFISYHEKWRPLILTVERDNEFIAKFEKALVKFEKLRQQKIARLRELI